MCFIGSNIAIKNQYKPQKESKQIKINTLDVINIEEELLADSQDFGDNILNLKKIPKSYKSNKSEFNEGILSLKFSKSPFSAQNSKAISTASKEKPMVFDNSIDKSDIISPKNQNLSKGKHGGKKFKRSQINYANNFSKDRAALKEPIKNFQNSNKNNLSLNNTNDTSIPEVRLMKGILSGNKLERNNNLTKTNGSKSFQINNFRR
jgi:hypothetical protein